MSIQGMELFAIGVVVILFMAVLKQFGILEPISLEGKYNVHGTLANSTQPPTVTRTTSK